ncbi:DegV family protein [Demequina aurantiaca]|uniref:DegV family protein n=1 Tax=Demequina aurantiaca TaxID=676200 RepID=UPI00078475C9|nr:DegV family protein [Demequina aurantiaca]
MAERTVAVITDSVCGLAGNVAAEFGVYLIPVRVTTPDGTYSDGAGFGPDDAIAAIVAGKKVETAEPQVAAMANAFAECANAGAQSIVCVHVSSELSGTVGAARAAAATSPIPVTVVDTGTTGMAQGYAALAAGAVSLAGGTNAEVARAAEMAAESSQVYFTVDTLDFLRRSGRISGAIATLGSMFKLRPIMGIRNGKVESVDRKRGTDAARSTVRELAERRAGEMVRPAGAVGLVGSEAVPAEFQLSISGPTLESDPPTSLAIHAGPGMYYAAVAQMPQAYFDVLRGSSLASS